MAAPDAIGVSYVKIPVTNNSSGRSDYWIELVIESADGATQLDTASAFVEDLEAGQSTTAEAMVTDADPSGRRRGPGHDRPAHRFQLVLLPS